MTILAPLPVQSFKDNNGNPLAGGLLYTYVAGTSTPLSTFTDSTGATPNTNPIVLNSRGEAQIWLTGGLAYKLILQDSAASLIWTADQIVTPAASGSNADITSLGSNTSTIYTTGGTSTAYTITPVPAYAAYAAGMSFMCNFNAACGTAPTLAISGLATPPSLVKENRDGTFSTLAANDIPINHRSRVTLISATQALVETVTPVRSWVNMTASRALGTNYTAPNYEIDVMFRGSSANAVTASVQVYVNGVAIGTTSDAAGVGSGGFAYARIPPFSTYQIANAAGLQNLSTWFEYR